MKSETDTQHDAYFWARLPFDSRRDVVWKEVSRFLQKRYIPAESRILDLGAGYCNFINHVQGRQKHALDISSQFRQWAADGVSTHVRSCTDLTFLDENFFDVVFASNLFEHLTREELSRTLHGLRRILRPGGTLILLQPNFRFCYRVYFDDYTHVQIFTDEGLCAVVQVHGFDIIDVKPRFLPVNMDSTLRITPPRLDLVTRLYLHLPFKPLAGQMLIVAQNQEKAAESE